MRFEVPQFIEVEDKIVGPFTWKQFVYLAGGGGFLVILYLLLPFLMFIILGLPIAALAGFLAFHRVNNRPFSSFLEAFFHFMTQERLYLWRKEEAQTIVVKGPEFSHSETKSTNTTRNGSLASLSRKLELNTLNKK